MTKKSIIMLTPERKESFDKSSRAYTFFLHNWRLDRRTYEAQGINEGKNRGNLRFNAWIQGSVQQETLLKKELFKSRVVFHYWRDESRCQEDE